MAISHEIIPQVSIVYWLRETRPIKYHHVSTLRSDQVEELGPKWNAPSDPVRSSWNSPCSHELHIRIALKAEGGDFSRNVGLYLLE
jgi:hypothetical protein